MLVVEMDAQSPWVALEVGCPGVQQQSHASFLGLISQFDVEPGAIYSQSVYSISANGVLASRGGVDDGASEAVFDQAIFCVEAGRRKRTRCDKTGAVIGIPHLLMLLDEQDGEALRGDPACHG
jgi:hypothetical protein